MAMTEKHVVVIAGPAGSGKDSILKGVLKHCSNTTKLVTTTTRRIRPGEQEGVDYYFTSNDRFKEELQRGNIFGHYYRSETDTYYGTATLDLESLIETGKIVLCQIQILGAKYLKEHYGATTFFIMPPSLEALERRVRARSPISDIEWQERLAFTRREVAEEAPWYDYRISNEDGKLDEAIEAVIEILKKEGYNLGL
jgi:guanylate kinase